MIGGEFMSTFSYSIQTAFLCFPFVALFFTIPYMLFQYHKYGSINSYRSLLIYSFLLYLLCAYFLVILPLPSIEFVSNITTPSYNLRPFYFVSEILNKTNFTVSDFATYFPTMKNPAFYEAFFNMLLTVPFGIYLHYYFKCNFKKTFFYSFCFSLFFELTQLTGLYFIYPRSYRVFDVDDLIINTFGGCVGYVLGFLFLKFLPSREEIDQKTIEKGSTVSFLKRVFSFGIDFTLFFLFSFCIWYFGKKMFPSSIIFFSAIFVSFFLFFLLLPFFLKGKTLGMKFLKLQFLNYQEKHFFSYFSYFLLFVIEYFFLPFFLFFLTFFLFTNGYITQNIYSYMNIGVGMFTLMLYVLSFLKCLFHSNLLYEKITNMVIVSTISIQK